MRENKNTFRLMAPAYLMLIIFSNFFIVGAASSQSVAQRCLSPARSWEEFQQNCDAAVRADPNNIELYFHRVRGWLEGIPEQPDRIRAIREYDEIIARGLGDRNQRMQAFWGRGKLWEALENYDRAIADYEELLKLEDFPYAHQGLARLHRKKGDFDRALHHINIIIERARALPRSEVFSPSSGQYIVSRSLICRGDILYSQGRSNPRAARRSDAFRDFHEGSRESWSMFRWIVEPDVDRCAD
jgi:tetratricopeptide (TPR) repeat protein